VFLLNLDSVKRIYYQAPLFPKPGREVSSLAECLPTALAAARSRLQQLVNRSAIHGDCASLPGIDPARGVSIAPDPAIARIAASADAGREIAAIHRRRAEMFPHAGDRPAVGLYLAASSKRIQEKSISQNVTT
jgi:hypothetical protein